MSRPRRRKPPPGPGHLMNEASSGAHGSFFTQPVYHDGSPSPAGTGPFKKRVRRKTRPTPGASGGPTLS